jgi:hypothetical protein
MDIFSLAPDTTNATCLVNVTPPHDRHLSHAPREHDPFPPLSWFNVEPATTLEPNICRCCSIRRIVRIVLPTIVVIGTPMRMRMTIGKDESHAA